MEKQNGEFLWVEMYRPKTIDECVLPDRIKKVFQSYVDENAIPNLLLSGSAGVGKTTAAIAMCKQIGLNYMFINSSDERGIDTLRTKIKNYASTTSLTNHRKVIILDEADYLTADAQAALRGAIEEFSSNCTFIMTCNMKDRLMSALHSRMVEVNFTLLKDEKPKMAARFMKRLEQILTMEKVTYDKAALAKIVQKYFPDYRKTISELQRFSKFGSIDAGVVSQLSDVKKIDELVDALKGRDFSAMRKWVVLNTDLEASRIFRCIYDSLYDYMKPQTIPQAVVILAKYAYQSGFVADQEINLVACLTEIMIDCEFN